MIPHVDSAKISAAMGTFDKALRDTVEWRDWEGNRTHRYAILSEDLRYPVKQIIRMATGASHFSGGRESNDYLAQRGFEVISLRKSDDPGIQSCLEKILSSYIEISQTESFGQHPDLWRQFETFRARFEASATARSRPHLKVSWSVGRGRWARVPWIAFFDERETSTVQKGVFCVLLFRADMSGVYLAFGRGVTEPRRRLGPTGALEEIRGQVDVLRDLAQPLTEHGFLLDGRIDVRVDAGLGRDYESSTAAYKLYDRGSVPEDEDILDDITALLSVYDRYLEEHLEEIVPNEVDRGGLDAMRNRFVAHFPEFESFSTAGPDTAYGIEERNYKVELVDRFRNTLAPRLAEPAKSDDDEELLAEAVFQFLRQKLDAGGRPQNLLSWRDYDFFNHLDGAGKRRFVSSLRDLLYGPDSTGAKVEIFNQRFAEILKGTKSKFIPAWSRLLPTFFLMVAFPKTEIFVKTTQFDKTAKEVMGWPKLESRPFDAAQYDRMKELTDAVKAALEDWRWAPRDMLDVQSFIWVAQSPTKVDQPDQVQDQIGLVYPVRNYVAPSIEEIRQHVLETEGLRLGENVLRQYHVALEARGFVILSGISGSGKTWLAEAYGRAVAARCLLVPVAPNWTTNEDLLGFFNPLDGEYHHTPFSRFLKESSVAYTSALDAGVTPQPFHLILDEMNLARVEYYFAKFLSAMELRARQDTATIELGPTDSTLLTPNLRFIGTVNIDETTHGFADKVYDRAQLIELEVPRHLLAEHIGDAPFAGALMEVWDCVNETAPFGFRILDDVKTYVLLAQELGVGWEEAFDEQVRQKVLPKIKGADPRVGDALQHLIDLAQNRFPLTHAKAVSMLDRFQQHGFTSYF